MTGLAHVKAPATDRSTLLTEGACAADCAACAEEQRRVQVICEHVLGMWLQAIEAGERTPASAQAEVIDAIRSLPARNAVLGAFIFKALEARQRFESNEARRPRVGRKPTPPRGLPTAWKEATRSLVELVAEQEGLPRNHANQSGDDGHGYASVYIRVADIWKQYGLRGLTARQVQSACEGGKD